jgi:hypothetical protein
MPITDAKLDKLGAKAARKLCKDDCEILRESGEENESGGRSDERTVAGTFKCALISQGIPQERVVAGQKVGIVPQTLFAPRGTDIRSDDWLRTGGVTYRIIDLYSPESYEVLRKVSVVRVSLPS